jgi:hypothetical protein
MRLLLMFELLTFHSVVLDKEAETFNMVEGPGQ